MQNQTLSSEKPAGTELHPWRMLGWLLFTQVLVAFVGRSLAPLGVFIGDSLSLTNAQIGMLPAALFFGQFAASIPAGILADRIGTRPLLLALSLCLGLSFIAASSTTSFLLLLFFFAIGGFGYGAMHPTSNRGILYWFEHRRRGTAMGIKQMGITAGSALASLLLVPLSASYGWRPVLIGAALLLTVAGMISYLRYRDSPAAPVKKNTKGESEEEKRPSVFSMAKNRALLLVSIGAAGINGSQMALNTYLIIYATQILGLPITLAAVLLVISEVGGSFGRVGWGMVSDRFFSGNRMIILMLISVISAVAAVVMAMLEPGVPFLAIAGLTLVLGLCVSGFNGLWMNAATEIVPIKQAGLATGFSISIGSWGPVIGPPLFGLTTDITGVFSAGWYGLAAILTITAAIYMYLHLTVKTKGE